LAGVKSVVVADYKYRVGNYTENMAYLLQLRRDWDDPSCFKPKKYNVTADDLCQFVDRSLNEQVHYYLPQIDCIYIAGSRFDPSSEHCTEKPTRVNPDIRREQFEIRLMQLAMEMGIPTLVVCAGMWRIASAFGAKTTALPEANVRTHHEQWKTVRQPDKATMLVPGTALQQLHSSAQNNISFNLMVNSTHWRAVPPPETQSEWTAYNRRFITTAWDNSYGNVEAVEAKHHAQFWGKQWHKEQVEPGAIHYETHRKILEDLLVKGGLFFSKKQAVHKEIQINARKEILFKASL
jgi:gamma-glutamyl-gamma-aminobutyrate hydrolase PuuD